MKKVFYLIAAWTLLLLLAACSGSQDDGKTEWGYDGDLAAVNWGTLSEEFIACSAGMEQSPIDISSSTQLNEANLEFMYTDSQLEIENNGHTIQANYDAGSSVIIDGEVYNLLQFHFHAGSENTFDGVQTPLEVHFVHANANGGLAVIGVLIEEGAQNAAYAPIFDNMPEDANAKWLFDKISYNAMDLLPEEKTYWRFDGSLTTPPCSEGVKWHVMDNTIEMSAEQIAQFTSLYDNNFRPVQAMNEREFIFVQAENAEKAEWGYDGELAATNWGSLSQAYAACSIGLEQSPINIPADAPVNNANLEFAYSESALNIFNNGHTIQANYDAGSTVMIDGQEYTLLQFHFHAGSENTLGGDQTPMEIHFVHANPNGGLAVIGVMIEEGAENAAYSAVLNNMPAEKSDIMTIEGESIDALAMMPETKTYWRFDGSLTTPPCSEGVKWHVMNETIELSAEQIDQFVSLYDNNFRPVQEMNTRQFIVVEGDEADGDDADGEKKVDWGYDGAIAAANWGDLSPEFIACSAGMEQSPIDIPVDAALNAANLEFSYAESALNILNNGHTIQANYDEGSSVMIDGEVYNLLQFHFHAGSETTFSGDQAPLEIHFVHANANGGLAVVGVMLVEGAENPAYAEVFNNMPVVRSDVMSIEGASVSAMDMLPESKTYYRFDGSLTTPPCSEGVKWHVMSEVVELSAAQIAQFTDVYNNNFRPVQELNAREFIVVGDAADASDAMVPAVEPADGDADEAVAMVDADAPDWASLSLEHAACASGLISPIVDMKVITLNDLEEISFNYGDSAVEIVNNEEAVKIEYSKGDGLEIDRTLYSLVQFQFLTPNAFLEGGAIYPGEFFRLIHADEDNNLAIACAFDKQYQP